MCIVSNYPYTSCTLEPKDEPIDPCVPSPCGPYSICRVVSNHAVCSCQDFCNGSPPNCRPECMINSECSRDKSCINQRCVDPCPGTCGVNARCRTVNHNPICSCNPGFMGDPFVRCSPEPSKISNQTLWLPLLRSLSLSKLLLLAVDLKTLSLRLANANLSLCYMCSYMFLPVCSS